MTLDPRPNIGSDTSANTETSVPTDLVKQRVLAKQMAYGLGISLYLHPNGDITQNRPEGIEGEGVEHIAPGPGAKPSEHKSKDVII